MEGTPLTLSIHRNDVRWGLDGKFHPLLFPSTSLLLEGDQRRSPCRDFYQNLDQPKIPTPAPHLPHRRTRRARLGLCQEGNTLVIPALFNTTLIGFIKPNAHLHHTDTGWGLKSKLLISLIQTICSVM